MQQQKLNVLNTIQLKGVSGRYMTSRIYHPEQKKCYIFVGTSQMIYFMAVKKESTEEPRDQDQQQYKLQEFKKIEQTESVFTCLSTMLHFNDVLVLLGFVQKQTLYSQLHVYSSNANQIYFNPNLFNEPKINLLNMKQKSYAKIQLLFTSSSDYAVRVTNKQSNITKNLDTQNRHKVITKKQKTSPNFWKYLFLQIKVFRFVDTRTKKYLFELQLLHVFRFQELIIDFDMKCILRGERCVLSHELSNSRVSVGNFDEGLYAHEFKRSSSKNYGDSNGHVRNSSPSLDRNSSEIRQSQQQLSEKILSLDQKQVSLAVDENQMTLNALQSQQSGEQQTSPRFLKAKRTLQHSANNLEGLSQNIEEDIAHLPDLQSMKRTHTSDGHNSYSQTRVLSPRRHAMRSAVMQYNGEEEVEEEGLDIDQQTASRKNSQKIDDDNNVQRQFVRKDSTQRSHTVLHYQHSGEAGHMGFGLQEGESMQQQLPGVISQLINSRQDSIKSNRGERKDSGYGPVPKPDEMYLSFADLEGMVIVKKFKVNPEGIDLSGSFANCATSYEVDLGISASYCKFLKCTENSLQSLEVKQSQLSKKQQRKQVKFHQGQKQKQLIQLISEEDESKNRNNSTQNDIQIGQSVTQQGEAEVQQSKMQQSQQNLQNALREVNLNLIVSSLMGEVIEFKNVPQKGLSNPVAFPTVDNYNSGVTGLCVKSQDSLEILVSYFDGSVIFFDLNDEDTWNLKLSQPLNSNHFGVYYENTFDSDVVFLISDDTLQIYELNNYHIN